MTLEDRPGFDADEAERRILPPTPEVPNAVAGKVVDRRHGPSVPAKRLPVWRVTTAGTAGRHAAHVIAFTKRAPIYATKVAARAPVGVYRIVGGTYRWVVDVKGRERHAQVTMTHEQLSAWEKERSTKLWTKVAVLGAAGFVVLPSAWTFLSAASALTITLIAIGSLLLLGIIGRRDKPATTEPDKTKLDADAIQTALASLGDARLARTKTGESPVKIRYTGRDDEGWRADIDLPPGVTAQDVLAKRDRLASALRQPVACVWPDNDPHSHPGRLIIWIADQPMSKQPPVEWPLANTGRVDLFKPFEIGKDPRGRPVMMTMMGRSMVIGGQPDMGKSSLLAVLLSAGALDPRCRMYLYNLKGSSDFLPYESAAHRLRTGDKPDDIAAMLTDLRGLVAEMQRRYEVVTNLPRNERIENKVTTQLADRRELGLHPILLAVDECQIAFEHAQHGAELKAMVTDLTRRGRAVAVFVVNATQRPDAKSLPPTISSNAALRACFKVATQVANDMVLGQSMHQAGIAATRFATEDQGICYLAGEGRDPQIVRVAYVVPHLETIIDRAYAARDAAGLLSGQSAGDLPPDESPPTVFLKQLAAVWPAGAPSVQWGELGDLLGMPGEQVSMSARSFGIKSEPVTRKGKHARGMYRAALDSALSPTTPPPEEN